MRVKKSLILGAVVIVLGIAGLIYVAANNPTRSLPPFQNPDVRYEIGTEDSPSVKDGKPGTVKNYTLSYRTSWFGSEVTGSVLIGRSTVDLAPHVGKQVRFRGTSRYGATHQCIRDDCHLLFGRATEKAAVVDIDSLTTASD